MMLKSRRSIIQRVPEENSNQNVNLWFPFERQSGWTHWGSTIIIQWIYWSCRNRLKQNVCRELCKWWRNKKLAVQRCQEMESIGNRGGFMLVNNIPEKLTRKYYLRLVICMNWLLENWIGMIISLMIYVKFGLKKLVWLRNSTHSDFDEPRSCYEIWTINLRFCRLKKITHLCVNLR